MSERALNGSGIMGRGRRHCPPRAAGAAWEREGAEGGTRPQSPASLCGAREPPQSDHGCRPPSGGTPSPGGGLGTEMGSAPG